MVADETFTLFMAKSNPHLFCLVVWNSFYFSIGNVIIRTELTKSIIFQRGMLKPPTSFCYFLTINHRFHHFQSQPPTSFCWFIRRSAVLVHRWADLPSGPCVRSPGRCGSVQNAMAKAQAPGNPHVMAKRSKSALKMHLEKPEMAGFSVFRTSYKNDCEKTWVVSGQCSN